MQFSALPLIVFYIMKFQQSTTKYKTLNPSNLKELNLFNQDSSFTEALTETYLSTKDTDIQILVYRNGLENLKGHEEFSFYHRKIMKLENTMQELLAFNLEKKLLLMQKQVVKKTKQLTDSEEIYAENVRLYSYYLDEQLHQFKKSPWIALIQKLELQLNDLKRNLPKLAPPVIIETYEWEREKPEFQYGIAPQIRLLIPHELPTDSAIIYHGFSGGVGIGHSGIDIWKKVRNRWRKVDSRITRIK